MNRRLALLAVFFLMFTFMRHTYAQTSSAIESPPRISDVGNDNPSPSAETAGPQLVNYLSDYEFWLSLIVIFFGVFVVVIEYRLLVRVDAGPADIMRVLAVTLILVGSLFLITAGFSNNQISPVSGLFGTVAGYLLGKSSKLKRRTSRRAVPVERGEEGK